AQPTPASSLTALAPAPGTAGRVVTAHTRRRDPRCHASPAGSAIAASLATPDTALCPCGHRVRYDCRGGRLLYTPGADSGACHDHRMARYANVSRNPRDRAARGGRELCTRRDVSPGQYGR